MGMVIRPKNRDDDAEFDAAVERALRGFGDEVRGIKPRRIMPPTPPDQVLDRLRKEIENLRPHADRLLHGEKK